MTDVERFEYRFLWDAAEHRRFCRVLQQEVRQRSKVALALKVWFGLVAVVFGLALVGARDRAGVLGALPPLVVIVAWFVFDRWGLPYLPARSYERDHAPCLPNDQVRIVSATGLEANCTSTKASISWSGIARVRETPDFFLFFTTPNCAVHVPKRSVENVEQLRAWLGPRLDGAARERT
jgi:hypothetical protein